MCTRTGECQYHQGHVGHSNQYENINRTQAKKTALENTLPLWSEPKCARGWSDRTVSVHGCERKKQLSAFTTHSLFTEGGRKRERERGTVRGGK